MKTLFTFLMLFAFATTPAAYADNHDPVEMSAGTYDAAGELVKVQVNGLVCDFCARAVEKVFMKKGPVAGVNVNLSEHLVLVSLKQGQNLSDDTIAKLINDAGYAIVKIDRSTEE